MELNTDLVNQTSPSQTKIAVFRSLFRGREDIYPRRFESRKTGRAGYRHDRRQDQLLQQNGYPVLRFLAEDAGKELNLVLDTILRSLRHRRASGPAVHPSQS